MAHGAATLALLAWFAAATGVTSLPAELELELAAQRYGLGTRGLVATSWSTSTTDDNSNDDSVDDDGALVTDSCVDFLDEVRLDGRDHMEGERRGWDGMGWDGMGWDGMGRHGEVAGRNGGVGDGRRQRCCWVGRVCLSLAQSFDRRQNHEPTHAHIHTTPRSISVRQVYPEYDGAACSVLMEHFSCSALFCPSCEWGGMCDNYCGYCDADYTIR